MTKKSAKLKDIARFSELFDTEDEVRRAVFQATHRVLSTLQIQSFEFDFSSNNFNNLALSISKSFSHDNETHEHDLKNMLDNYMKQQEIKKLEGYDR